MGALKLNQLQLVVGYKPTGTGKWQNNEISWKQLHDGKPMLQ